MKTWSLRNWTQARSLGFPPLCPGLPSLSASVSFVFLLLIPPPLPSPCRISRVFVPVSAIFATNLRMETRSLSDCWQSSASVLMSPPWRWAPVQQQVPCSVNGSGAASQRKQVEVQHCVPAALRLCSTTIISLTRWDVVRCGCQG